MKTYILQIKLAPDLWVIYCPVGCALMYPDKTSAARALELARKAKPTATFRYAERTIHRRRQTNDKHAS